MKCPFCANEDTRVLDSRQVEEGTAVRRRRECDRCSRRFTTYEKYEDAPFLVVKKDGSREPFLRAKMSAGMLRACNKRPISTEQIEQAAFEIEKSLRNQHEREVRSFEVGEAVLDRLFHLDEVAYIRFASVYREFKDVQRFMEELDDLRQRRASHP
ncbi:Ribonucleotide reductase regulator NrdR-like [Acididesulfobacillus acetoxydans]|uniref:Transcriptional repressor NrdR n=1 Tax=Acididesulfobacillus acetoxydans TaxID=1561005 RepID=A0A8S0WEE0_9FIRM|nr:transcriptional regulator NrdR [Acididesulfobacillus acetoxydans]CAA7600032.1 Ribonucleotide reductase regulator NrdR-like [Acididesulfobacillus acetoxydans]CEJ07807.1 Transcriptional repressor NrdR [Acididesulfobacillus acetoxydans]